MGKKKKKKSYDQYESIPKEFYERIISVINEMKFTKNDLKELARRYIEIQKIKTKKIHFVLYMVPEPSHRPRYNRIKNKFYVPNAANLYKFFNKFLQQSEMEDYEIIYTPCKIDCKYYMPIPSSMSNKIDRALAEIGLIKHMVKPDWDNLGKTTDMMNGNLLIDDAIVYDSRVRKYYSFKPRIEITIEYDLKFDSKFNSKKMKEKNKTFNQYVLEGLIKEYDGGVV